MPTNSNYTINLSDLSTEQFSTEAENIARGLTPDRQARKYRQSNKTTQLRKFYDELVMWHDKVNKASDAKAEYDKLAPFIHMLRAKVAYSLAREHVNPNFQKFFNTMIQQVNSPETLLNAKLLFEAVIGFRKANE